MMSESSPSRVGPRRGARIIVTGGTFDKRYDAIKGELTFTQTHLPALLEQARVRFRSPSTSGSSSTVSR